MQKPKLNNIWAQTSIGTPLGQITRDLGAWTLEVRVKRRIKGLGGLQSFGVQRYLPLTCETNPLKGDYKLLELGVYG